MIIIQAQSTLTWLSESTECQVVMEMSGITLHCKWFEDGNNANAYERLWFFFGVVGSHLILNTWID